MSESCPMQSLVMALVAVDMVAATIFTWVKMYQSLGAPVGRRHIPYHYIRKDKN
jgi:hypothetical protein